MNKKLLFVFNIFYFLWIAFTAIFFAVFLIVFVAVFVLSGRGSFDDAFRYTNQYYGNYLVYISYPFIRIKNKDFKKLKITTSSVIVYNHRSFSDIIFGSLIPIGNLVVFIRSWPLKIPLFNYFMKWAKYVDIEKENIDDYIKQNGEKLKAKKASFLFFPEGHRSKDGKLLGLKSGAFYLAAALDIPIVVVCMEGTEKVAPVGSLLIHPAVVKYKVLGILKPADFPEDKRALKIKRFAEKMYHKHFEEN